MATHFDRRAVLKALAVAPVLSLPMVGRGAADRHTEIPASQTQPDSDPDWWAFRLDAPKPITALLFGGDSWTLEGENAKVFAGRRDRRWHRLGQGEVPRSESSSASIVLMANPDDFGSFFLAYQYAIRASKSNNGVVLLAARPDPELRDCTVPWQSAIDREPTGETVRNVVQTRLPEERSYFLCLIEETAKQISSSVIQDYDCRIFASLNTDTSVHVTGYHAAQHVTLGALCFTHDISERETWWVGGDAEGEGRAKLAAEEAFQRLPKLDADRARAGRAGVLITAGPELTLSEIQEVRRMACARFQAYGMSMLVAGAVPREDLTHLAVDVDLIAPKSDLDRRRESRDYQRSSMTSSDPVSGL